MRKNNIILPVTLFLIAVLMYFNFGFLKIMYYKFTKKRGSVSRYDFFNKRAGEFLKFKNGVVVFNGSFKDGKKEGWSREFYDDGKLKNKIFYKQGKEQGYESAYYADGSLRYMSNWEDGKYFGNAYFYSKNGLIYNCLDRKNLFYYAEYNISNKLKRILGKLFSSELYIKDHFEKLQSFVAIDKNKVYQQVNDFYIVLATPPNFEEEVTVKVNNTLYHYKGTKVNTLQVLNAFPTKGKFIISIRESLYDMATKKNVKSDSLQTVFTKYNN